MAMMTMSCLFDYGQSRCSTAAKRMKLKIHRVQCSDHWKQETRRRVDTGRLDSHPPWCPIWLGSCTCSPLNQVCTSWLRWHNWGTWRYKCATQNDKKHWWHSLRFPQWSKRSHPQIPKQEPSETRGTASNISLQWRWPLRKQWRCNKECPFESCTLWDLPWPVGSSPPCATLFEREHNKRPHWQWHSLRPHDHSTVRRQWAKSRVSRWSTCTGDNSKRPWTSPWRSITVKWCSRVAGPHFERPRRVGCVSRQTPVPTTPSESEKKRKR